MDPSCPPTLPDDERWLRIRLVGDPGDVDIAVAALRGRLNVDHVSRPDPEPGLTGGVRVHVEATVKGQRR